MALSDPKLRNIKTNGKAQKFADRDGLYAFVSPTGAISFRYDYRLDGKRYTLTIGRYPEKSLAGAREEHLAARKLVEARQSPARLKQTEKHAARITAANTFKAFSEQWFASKAPHRSHSWADGTRRWLDKQIYPKIGTLALTEIKPSDVLAIMKAMEKLGTLKSAECARGVISQVFDYAIRNHAADFNQAQSVRGAVMVPPPKRRTPMLAADIPAFMEALDAYPGKLATKLGFKLLLLTFVRKNELAEAPWTEFDLDKAEWRIPPERMKMQGAHIVPLSRQAVECLKELKLISCNSPFVFPNHGAPDKPMSGTTFNKALDTMGYGGKFTPHGFRATASTILNEQGFRPDLIERQLAHTERDRVRAAYNHAEYLEERRRMLQHWADYIDGLCSGGNVVSLRSNTAA